VKVAWDAAKNLANQWTERDEDTVRIISARWATERERSLYVHYLKENR
jgi:uncharacterized DUF497 family protein